MSAMSAMKIGGYAAFSGYEDDPSDPDGAEIALRRAGFQVMRCRKGCGPAWNFRATIFSS